MIVHGSGPTDVTHGDGGYNSSYDELRAAFREAGIATVIWDKPGNGCSHGAYASGTPLVERTSETVAAIATLKQRQDIDPSRIGLWAISQGGWIAPMAAVRAPETAFLIVVSGAGREVTAETEYYAFNRLQEQGVGITEARTAIAALRRAFLISSAGGSREDFLAATAPLEKYLVFGRELGITETPEMKASAAAAKAYRANQLRPDYVLRADAYLKELRQPVLAIFGDHDIKVDWRTSVTAYRESLAGNPGLTIRIFENADHELRPVQAVGKAAASRFVDGYAESMIAWLKARGFARSTSGRRSRGS